MNDLSGKKVIFYLPSLEMGGSERQALLLATYLKEKKGARVEVWGIANRGRAATFCEERGIGCRLAPFAWSWNPVANIRNIVNLGRELKRSGPDVILPYTVTPSVICGLVWRRTGARVCIWNQRDTLVRRLTWLQRKAAGNTPLFVSNSHHGARHLENAFNVPRSKITVVYNGIQLHQKRLERGEWRRNVGALEEDFLAVMIANIHAGKDHETLLKAWVEVNAGLAAAGRNGILLLAGYAGNTFNRMQALAQELGIGRTVIFLGKVEDIHGLVSASDVGIMSSVSEGCPNGLLECMAAGLAVTGTDVPGIQEAVGPSGRWFLAPPKDARALAQHILRFALSPGLRKESGEANRRRIQTVFNPVRVCEQMVALMQGERTDP